MARSSPSACWSTPASCTGFPTRPPKAFVASRSRRASSGARWSIFACASFSRVCAAMSKEPTRPSDSLVQQLLTERRELKVAVERRKIELADAQATGGAPDPRSRELQELGGEVERLRYQLASARAEATNLREERDHLRGGIERALEQLKSEQ